MIERAVPILPGDDLAVAREFYAGRLGFTVVWEATDDGRHGLLGLQRGGIELTIDCPMSGHGRHVCVSLRVTSADAYYEEWRQTVAMKRPPQDEAWGARTFGITDPFGNSIYVMGPRSGNAPEQPHGGEAESGRDDRSSSTDDLDGVAAIRRSLEAAENAGDADAAAALLADDAVVMVPDFPVQEGRDACGTFLRDILPWQHTHLERHITYVSAEVFVAGELAVDRGTFSFTVAPRSGGDQSMVTGKYLWLLRRTAGAWKVARLIASRDEETPSSGDQ